jgi:hypothetical protein
MEQREKLQLVIEQLEERIAPGKNNNGYGNGADCSCDGPGNSGDSTKFGDVFNANFGGNTDAAR